MTESEPHSLQYFWLMWRKCLTLLGQVLDNIRKVSSLSKVSRCTMSNHCNLTTVGRAYNPLWRILPHNTKLRNTYSGVLIPAYFIALTVTYLERLSYNAVTGRARSTAEREQR